MLSACSCLSQQCDACILWAKQAAVAAADAGDDGLQLGVEFVLGGSTTSSSSGGGSSRSSSRLAASSSSASLCSSDVTEAGSGGSSTTACTTSSCGGGSQLQEEACPQPPAVECCREPHECVTEDGWKLHITHAFNPAPPAPGSKRPQHPVLMVPGLASSGEHTFDLLPGHSLVEALVAAGYDVWVADLRGNGRSQRPRLLDRRTWWNVDDHCLSDAPAVLQYVLEATGATQLHWVGHSMGGMLAVGLQSRQHPLAGSLRSISLLASGCFGSGSWHSLLTPLINSLTRFGFPAGAVAGGIGALAGRATAASLPLEVLFYVPCNTPRAAAAKLMANCFAFIPGGVVSQFMGSLNSGLGLAAADGSWLYANPQALALCGTPVMALSGAWDLFCPPEGARRTVELFGGPHKRFVCVGPSHGNARRAYGHFDILVGRDAHKEVYPHVTAWLAEHDAPRPQRGGGAAASAGAAAGAAGARAPRPAAAAAEDST